MSEVEIAIDGYLRRMPGAAEAFHSDPTYHAQFTFMKRVLHSVNMAMADEGITHEMRLRIMRAVLFGAPNPDERLLKMTQLPKNSGLT